MINNKLACSKTYTCHKSSATAAEKGLVSCHTKHKAGKRRLNNTYKKVSTWKKKLT